MRRVLILYTGGTFGMDPADGSASGALAVPAQSPERLRRRFLSQVPELSKIAECEVEVVFNRDSSHVGPAEWLELAKRVQKRWKSFDGVVILHGTDTLAYTASALSFLLRPCLKPVILTGAQRPLASLRSDARRNLISAVEIAADGPTVPRRQVSILFDDRLLQGNRARKRSAFDFRGFESPKAAPTAVIGTSIRYMTSSKRARTSSVKLRPKFDSKVAMLQVTPAFPAREILEGLLPRIHGLVLVAFSSGTAPTQDPDLILLLREARKRGIPVVIANEGETDVPGDSRKKESAVRYSAGQALHDEGCFFADRLTPECAYIKTSMILGQPRGAREFAKHWKANWAYEGDTE